MALLSRFLRAVVSVAAVCVTCVTAPSLQAQTTYSWTGSQSPSWSTNNPGPLTNWVGNVVPPSDVNDTIISFDANSTANLSTNNDLGAFSVLGIVVTSPTGAVSISGGTLTIGANGINMSAATQALTISAGVVTSGVQNWNVAGGQTLTASGSVTIGSALTVNGGGTVVMSGPVTLTGSLTLNNATGTLALSGANTGAGGVNLTAGTLNVNSATALGTGTLTIAGGTLNNTSAGAITLSANNAMAWNGDFAFGGSQALNLGTGAVSMNAARTITVNGTGALTVGGAITGATFGITKAGTGTLVLNGVIGTTTGGITISAGTLTLGGNNTNTGAISLASGATLNVNNAGALTTGTFTINGGTIDNTTAAAITNSKTTPMAWNGDFAFTGTQALNLGAGAVTLNAARTITVNGTGTTGVLTVGGGITGATFGITKAGTGTLTLNGIVGTTTGGVNANVGTLILTGTNTYTGATTVATGATLQLGNGTAGNIVIASGSAITNNGSLIFNPGTATNPTYANVITQSATGTLTLNGATASNPSGLTLSATTNNIGGQIILNQGRLIFTALTNIGNTTTPFIVNGTATNGGQIWGNAALAIANPLTLNGYGPLEAAGNLGAIRGFNGVSYTGTVLLQSNASVDPETGNTVTLSGVISGPGQFLVGVPGTRNPGGTVAITGANNSFTGGVFANGSVAAANAAAAFGPGAIIVGSTTITSTNSGITQSVANGIFGTNSITLNSGTVTLSQVNNFYGGVTIVGGTFNNNLAGALGSNLVTQSGGTFAQSAAVNGGVGFNLSGGTTNLSIANTYSGGAAISGTNTTNVTVAGGLNGLTTMTGGTLTTTILANPANNGLLSVSGGLITSSAASGGQFQNVNFGGTGVINANGQLAVGANPLVLNSFTSNGGTLQFDTTGPTSGGAFTGVTDLVSLTGTYSVGTGTAIAFTNGTNPTAAGNYRIIQFSGAAPTLANFTLPTAPAGLTYSLSTAVDPGFVNLVVAGSYSGITADWIPTGAGPSSWNNAANWTGGVIPKLAGDTANFNSVLTVNQTVTVDAQQQIGTLNLNPGAAFTYTINQGATAGAIVMNNGASAAAINNLAQNNTIAAPIVLFDSNTNVTAANGTTLTLSGVISGLGKLTIAGTGTGIVSITGANTFTGGIEVAGGTLRMSAVGGFGSAANLITMNGGTLSLNGTTTQITFAATQVVNFVSASTIDIPTAAGGTLTSGANPATAKYLTSAANQIQGSATITKTGNGDFQMTSANPTLSSNWVLNGGIIEAQNAYALGSGTATVNANAGIVTSGVIIQNAISLNGGTLSANSNNNGIFTATVSVGAGGGILSAAQFQATPTSVAQNFAVGGLSGSGPVSIIGPASGTAAGIVTLGGDTSGYTGTITVGLNGILGLGSNQTFGNSNLIVFNNASAGLALVADGDATANPQTLSYTLSANLSSNIIGGGSGNPMYYVGRIGATALSNTALNKTLSVTNALPFNATNTFNLTPLHGFGLVLTNQPALTVAATFNVAGTQASNVVPGLTIQNLGGAFGITKSGTGTLVLDTGNTFGTTGALIDITAGNVAAATDGALGNSANAIRLSTNNATQGFRALGTFSTGRTFTLNAAANAIDVTGGNTLTITSGLAYAAAANTLQKNDTGTLILSAAATGAPTSPTTITAGVLQISNSNQIGSGAITNATAGAALQLSGGATFTQAITLNSVGISSAVGGLTSVSGANTISGNVTIGGGSLITNQDSGNIFTLGPITNTTTGFNVGGAGIVVLSGAITGAGVVNAVGTQQVRITSGGNTTTGAMGAYGPGANIVFTGAAGGMSAGTVNAQFGGLVTLDNTTNNLNNRTSTGGAGAAFHTFTTLGSGSILLTGNAAASTTETVLGINIGRGNTTFTVSPNAAQAANLVLTATGGAWTRQAFSTAVFTGGSAPLATNNTTAGSASINTGAATTAANFLGAGTTAGLANYGVLPWALVNNNGTISLATSSVIGASGFVRNLGAGETTAAFVNSFDFSSTSTLVGSFATTSNLINTTNTTGLFLGEAVSGTGIPAGSYITAISPGVSFTISANTSAAGTNVPLLYTTANTNIGLTAASSGPSRTLTQTINSLTLGTGGSLTLNNSNQILTIGANALGGAIVSLDNAASISGGILTTGGNFELIFQTPSDLTVSSTIIGGGGGANNGLTKGGSGTLTLTGTSFHTGQSILNAGTLSLNNGNNTIRFANYMTISDGATLNLNGNVQLFTDVFSDSGGLSGLGTVGPNSTITGTAGSALVIKSDAGSRNYTGVMTGGMAVVQSGPARTWILTQNQTYTGPTLIQSGTVTLQNNAALSGTTALTIARATLNLDNTGSIDLPTRLPTSLGITLQGGNLTLTGRTQFTSATTVGTVSATEGSNTISVTQQTTGVSLAALTLTGLSRSSGATVNFTNTNGTLGTIGTNPRILYATAPTLTNSLIGGGFTVNGNDFASYIPTLGVGALGTAGFAGYSPLPLNNAAATDNVTMPGATNVALNSMTVNSLRVTGTPTVTFNAGQTLTLASGGLISSGNFTMGGAVNQGNLTSGGSELFLLGSATSVINSAITGSGVALVKSGSGTYTIAGTNTYTGGTYIDQGALTVAASGQLGTGGIFHNGGTLTVNAGGVIPSQAVTVSGNGVLNVSSSLGITGSTTLNSNTLTLANVFGVQVGQLVSGTGLPGGLTVTAINPTTNTVTLSGNLGITTQTGQTYTFLVNNSATALNFNNNGGTTAPTINVTGVLNLPTPAITASSNNVGTTSVLAGGSVDFANAATPTITVNPIQFNGQNLAPYQPTLNITSAIQNSSNAVFVTGGGNLQLGGASTFTGGVTLDAGTSLTLGGSSTNMANGAVLSGPLGTGTLTIGAGSTLFHDGTARTVANNVVVNGNFTFDAPSTASVALTLGQNNSTIALPAAAATTITVFAPNMIGAFSGTVTGSGSSIVKAGQGTLQLNNILGGTSTFSGGVTINAGTLSTSGIGATLTALGSGAVTVNGGVFALRHSGLGNNGVISVGNAVNIGTTPADAFIDINNNGANTGNTFLMGALNYSGFTAGSAAPATVVNVTGGNGYKILFNGSNLSGDGITSGASTQPVYNVGSGLTAVINAGTAAVGFTASNLPKNIGAGTLLVAGNYTGAAPASISTTQQAYVLTNASTTPLGTGGITLNTGATLQLNPIFNTLSTAGYTSGGMTAKYYNTGATALAAAANFGVAPGSVLSGVQPNDGLFRQAPVGVNNGGAANTLALYQGILNVTTPGTYYIGGGTDDQMQVTVNGQLVQNDLGAGHALDQRPLLPVTLQAGANSIVVRAFNNGGGGSVNFFFGGADTSGYGNLGLAVTNNVQAIPLNSLSYSNVYTAANGYQNAAILNNAITVAASATSTIDGLGTDFNYGIPSLSLGNGATLTVANGTGAAGFTGNGAFIVTGITDVTAGGGILSPTTGTLVLAGGVSDGGLGLTKTGAGNLILGASTNFTGALNINGGFVQLADPTSLTTGLTTIGIAGSIPATLDLNGQSPTTTGGIVLNGGFGPAGRSSNAGAGLYNSSGTAVTLPAGMTITLGAAISAVNPQIGGFGDITINGLIVDGAGTAFNKLTPNTLTLNGANSFSGVFTISAGRVVLGNASALGTIAGNTTVVGGATLDLNGISIAENLTINGTGITILGVPNTLGAVVNNSGTAVTLSGAFALATGSAIGSSSYSSNAGSITITGPISGAFNLNKLGKNNVTITSAAAATTFIDVQVGSLTFSGTGSQAASNNANLLRQGATMTLDNSATAVSNRMGNHGLWFSGNLAITGNNGTAVSEVINQGGNNFALGTTFANGFGAATMTLTTTGTSGVTVQVASTSTSIFARAVGSTLLLRGDGLGGTPGAGVATVLGNATSLGYSSNNGQLVGQNAAATGTGFGNANTALYPWAVVDTSSTGVGTSFATYRDNTQGIVPLSSVTNGFVAAAPTLLTVNSNTANTSTSVTVANATGLAVGMVVQGTGIAAGTTITAIAGTTLTLSVAATATANNTLTFSTGNTGGVTAPNLISTATTNAVGLATAGQILNSVTLNNPGAGATLAITGGLQLDSGGLLVVGTDATPTAYTISGGMLSAANGFNRELIFHTTGAQTTLTVNSPIFTSGGFTKADGGTLVLGATGMYTGDTSITGGVLKLAGGTNTIFKVFTTAPTSGNSNNTTNGGTFSGANFTVSFGGTLDLNGNTQAVANLRSGSAVPLAGGTVINSTGTATFHATLSGSQTWAGNISNAGAGVLNFARDGNNTFTVNSPNTFGGTFNSSGGATTLVDLGTFENASSVTVSRAALVWDDRGVQAVANRLSASAPITLNGGGLQFLGRAGSNATLTNTITLGTLNLGNGASTINAQVPNQGGSMVVQFAGIGTRTAGGTLNFGNAAYAIGDNPRVTFASAPTLTNGLIGGWATAFGLVSSTGGTNASFATYDPASGIRVLQYQPNATYGAGVNTMLTGSATLPAPANTATTTTVNSLTMYNGTTLSFTNWNDTLIVQSGGILTGTDANNKAIGSTTVQGRIVSGTGNDLYLNVAINTLTVNAKIVDNGSNNNLVISSLGIGNAPVVTLTNANTYGGTTYVSGVNLTLNSLLGVAVPGDLVISGTTSNAGDSNPTGNSIVNFNQSNQLAATSSITINGGAQINMGSGSNGLVSNTQTINNLTFNNDGGTNANVPNILTGAGTLTINGTLSSINIAEVASIPAISGFLSLTTGNIVVDANQYVPNQIGLAINANITATSITKTGSGYLGLGGQSANFTGAFNLNAGGLAVSATSGGTVGALLGGQVIMAANTTVDPRGLTGVFGSIVSSAPSAAILNGLPGTAGTVVTGLDNTSGTFAGTISSPYPTGLLSVTKIGTGTWTLTNDSSATNNGTLTVSGGGITLDSASAEQSFTTTAIQTGSTVTLDNSANALSNRLGGAFLSTTAATLIQTARTVTLSGGNLTVTGNASTVVNEALGTVNGINGSTITLTATGTAGVNLTLQSIAGQGQPTSLLIRGDGIGSAAGSGVATVRFANASATVTTTPGLGFPGSQGTSGNNTLTKQIRPDIIVDNTSTGLGAGFMTIDSATGLVRPLGFGAGITFANELSPNLNTATTSTTNVALSAVAFGSGSGNTLAAGTFSQNLVANSLTLQSGGGINLAIVAGNPWGANGALLSYTTTAAGVLNLAGANSITLGQLLNNGITTDYHVLAGSTLTLDGAASGNSGLVKAGGGLLILNQPQLTNAGSVNGINGGTLRLNGGNNTLFVAPSATIPSTTILAVNNGTLDLNGFSQLVSNVTTTNALPFAGGTVGSPNSVITNSSATAATFFSNNASATIGTVFSGNLNFDKAGNTTMTLTSPQTYTGTTVIRAGTLGLRDLATLNGTSSVTANYSNIVVDNTTFADIANRIPTATPVTLSGGGFRFSASPRVETNTFGTFTLNGGMNELMVNGLSTNAQGSQYTVVFNNLVQSNAGTLYINSPNNTIGNIAAATTRVYVSQLNGTPFTAASLVNGLVAPWMVVSTGTNVVEWASYTNVNGIIPLGSLGSSYSASALGASAITDNISVAATVQSVSARTINSLAVRVPAAATTIGLNGPLDQLTVATGGILINSTQAVTFQGGSLTAGSAGGGSPTLYLNSFSSGTTTFNTPIVNNSGVPLSVVRSGNGTVTLTPVIVETVASVPATSTTITVPNATGLAVGMGVSGTNVTAGTTITAISGTTVTLSAATGATAGTTVQVAFNPAQSTATASTTAGSTTVTVAAGTLPTNFNPAVGMTVGSSVNILGGTTITAVSGTGPWTLTLSQPATTTSTTAAIVFNPLSNSYTGTTILSSGSLNITGGTMNLSGLAGSIAIPGNVTINNSTLTMNTNQGQIATTSNITINGGGSLTLVGTNRFSTPLTFNNSGGAGTPTLTTGTLLDLSNTTAINATNDNTGTTPTITAGTLNLSSSTGTTINVSGLSPTGLIIGSTITTNQAGTTTSTGQRITKAGAGSLILPNADANALLWTLTGGTIIVNNATSLGNSAALGSLALSGNVGLHSGTGAQTIALPTILNANTNLTLGSTAAVNAVTLSGAMNLNGFVPTFTVNNPAAGASVISGNITGGTGGIIKAGAGSLTLSGTASTFTGPIAINGGLLTLGNGNALGGAANIGADVTVATSAAFNMNNISLSIGSLAGGGIVTNSGAAVQTLTIGAGSNATNATFSGALTAAAATTQNLAVTKTGTNIQTLSGQSYYTGATAVSGGSLVLKNGSTAATTPTLANTTVTVASGATFAVSAAGAAPATNNTVNIGNATTTNAGASLTLSNGANFDMRDTVLGTFNVLGNGTGTGFTTSSATTNLFFDIGNTGADLLALARGAAATGGTINLNLLSGTTSLPIGIVPLITATGGGFTGTGTNNFTLATTSLTVGPRTYNLSLSGAQNTANQTALAITVATPAAAYWSGAVDGNWNTGINTGVTNWRTDATSNIDTQAVPGAVTNVFFVTTTPAAANLVNTLNAAFTINSLNVTAAATGGVTIQDVANALTINATNANGNAAGNGISIAAGAGAVVINNAVVLGGNQTWTNNSSTALVLNGNVTGSANLTTVGDVTLAASNNAFSGTTTVASGELRVNGAITGTGAVSVAGTLSGNGSVAGPVTVNSGGTVRGSFGTGTGTLTTGNLTVTNGGSILTNIGATGVSSQIALGGATIELASTGTSTLKLVGITGFSNTQNGSWIVASNAGTITLGGVSTNPNDIFGTYIQGTGATGAVTIDVSAIGVTLNTNDTFTLTRDTSNVYLSFTAAVPEPVTVLGLAAAGLGLAGWVRRRNAK